MERVQAFMQDEGSALTRAPREVTSFQPIRLSWVRGRYYVSLDWDLDRSSKGAHDSD